LYISRNHPQKSAGKWYIYILRDEIRNFGCRIVKKTRRLDLVKVKIKVTLVQALGLCTGRTAHRGSRGIALLFHDHGTRSG